MLETVQSMSLLAIMEILGPVLLAIALIYAIVQWSRRPRAARRTSDEATRRLYREGEPEKEVGGRARERSRPRYKPSSCSSAPRQPR
jgi:hypothetical protein